MSRALDEFPRVSLGHWPTPLHPCRRLQERLGGPLIWLKRDDCSGLALGGNKTRKLEFLLGRALADGAQSVVTFGALQSNHARQTAAACAAQGLACDLVLTEAVDRPTEAYRGSGNRLLDDLLGATVHVVADNDAALVVAGELAAQDPSRFFIDPGGSSATGALGYVAAAAELDDQLRAAEVAPTSIVSASSTGGTVAGLAVGVAMVGLDVAIDAIAVYADAATTVESIQRITTDTATLLDVDPPPRELVTVDDTALGPGYGIETGDSHGAALTLARTEGVLLDPVYTAKAFAWLLARVPDADPAADVVFLHTGGQAGLFAYADAFS